MRVSLQSFKRKLNDDHPFAGNPHGISGVDEHSSILEMNHFRLEEKKVNAANLYFLAFGLLLFKANVLI